VPILDRSKDLQFSHLHNIFINLLAVAYFHYFKMIFLLYGI